MTETWNGSGYRLPAQSGQDQPTTVPGGFQVPDWARKHGVTDQESFIEFVQTPRGRRLQAQQAKQSVSDLVQDAQSQAAASPEAQAAQKVLTAAQVVASAAADASVKAKGKKARRAARNMTGWAEDRYYVTPDGKVVPIGSTPVYNVDDDNDARQYLEDLKLTPGLIDQIKHDLYWSGAYGQDAPIYGTEGYTQDDLDALKEMMDQANNAGATLDQVLGQAAAQGRARGGPLGTDVDPEDDPLTQINKYLDDNGITVSDDYVNKSVRAIAGGAMTVDQILNQLQKQAIAKYPAWEDQIKSGLSVSDIASPYITEMESMLELPSGAASLKDKQIQKALAGVGGDGKPTYKPLWQFREDLKNDERWQYTDNAWSEVSSQVDGVLSEMGLN